MSFCRPLICHMLRGASRAGCHSCTAKTSELRRGLSSNTTSTGVLEQMPPSRYRSSSMRTGGNAGGSAPQASTCRRSSASTRLSKWRIPPDAALRRMADDQRRVDGTDGRADDPVGFEAGLEKGLVDACLVRARRAAALQHQHHLAVAHGWATAGPAALLGRLALGEPGASLALSCGHGRIKLGSADGRESTDRSAAGGGSSAAFIGAPSGRRRSASISTASANPLSTMFRPLEASSLAMAGPIPLVDPLTSALLRRSCGALAVLHG